MTSLLPGRNARFVYNSGGFGGGGTNINARWGSLFPGRVLESLFGLCTVALPGVSPKLSPSHVSRSAPAPVNKKGKRKGSYTYKNRSTAKSARRASAAVYIGASREEARQPGLELADIGVPERVRGSAGRHVGGVIAGPHPV